MYIYTHVPQSNHHVLSYLAVREKALTCVREIFGSRLCLVFDIQMQNVVIWKHPGTKINIWYLHVSDSDQLGQLEEYKFLSIRVSQAYPSTCLLGFPKTLYWYLLRTYSISQEICTRFLLCCALLWLYIDWFSHIHQAYFTGTAAI